MISPQWSCITGKGLAQDTTQPIATTQREVRVLYCGVGDTEKGWFVHISLLFFFYFNSTSHLEGEIT